MKLLHVAAALTMANTAVSGPVEYSWATPVDGFWNDPFNWDPSGVPGQHDHALLGLTGPYTISLGPASQDITTLHISNPQATLAMVNGRHLIVRQAIVNHGRIAINPDNLPRLPELWLIDGSTISGTGIIELGAPGTFARLSGFFSTDSATHEAGHTIAGMGIISTNLINRGAVLANSPGFSLQLRSESHFNEGLFSAVDGGVLDIQADITQAPQGSVTASGPGSRIDFRGEHWSGGTLIASNGASIRLLDTSKLFESVQLEGAVSIGSGLDLTLINTQLNGVGMTIDPPHSADTTIAIGAGSQIDESTITLDSSQHRFEALNGAKGIVLSPGFTIHGQGTIQADAINYGVIRADRSGGELNLHLTHLDHHGLLEATNGATLFVSDSTITQNPGSQIRAAGPSTVLRFDNSYVSDRIMLEDGATVVFGSNRYNPRVTLDHVTLDGDSTVEPRTTVTTHGPLINNGTMRFLRDGTSANQILFEDGASIGGVGTMDLGDGNTEIKPLENQATVTLEDSQTIIGRGTFFVGLVIEGNIKIKPDRDIVFAGPLTISRNVLNADGGRMFIEGNFVQDVGSRIMAENNGGIILTGYGSQIVGGVLDIAEDSRFTVIRGTLLGVTVNGDTRVGTARTLALADGFTNNGRVMLNNSSSIYFENSMTIDGTGTISLTSDILGTGMTGADGVAVILGSGQRLEGSGRLNIPLTVHGRVAPGLGIGPLHVSKSFAFTPTATLEIEIAQGETDYFWVLDAVLDGTLEIQFVDEYTPASLYWDRIFMTAMNGSTGSFHTINGPELSDPRLEYRVTHSYPYFRVGTYCKADLNSDRQLNFFDMSEFITLFNAGDPAADLNGDGSINFFDMSAYVNLYNAGCP